MKQITMIIIMIIIIKLGTKWCDRTYTQNRLTPLSARGDFDFPSVSSPKKDLFWIGLMFCIDY